MPLTRFRHPPRPQSRCRGCGWHRQHAVRPQPASRLARYEVHHGYRHANRSSYIAHSAARLRQHRLVHHAGLPRRAGHHALPILFALRRWPGRSALRNHRQARPAARSPTASSTTSTPAPRCGQACRRAISPCPTRSAPDSPSPSSPGVVERSTGRLLSQATTAPMATGAREAPPMAVACCGARHAH
jgi:hypothetical protein